MHSFPCRSVRQSLRPDDPLLQASEGYSAAKPVFLQRHRWGDNVLPWLEPNSGPWLAAPGVVLSAVELHTDQLAVSTAYVNATPSGSLSSLPRGMNVQRSERVLRDSTRSRAQPYVA